MPFSYPMQTFNCFIYSVYTHVLNMYNACMFVFTWWHHFAFHLPSVLVIENHPKDRRFYPTASKERQEHGQHHWKSLLHEGKETFSCGNLGQRRGNPQKSNYLKWWVSTFTRVFRLFLAIILPEISDCPPPLCDLSFTSGMKVIRICKPPKVGKVIWRLYQLRTGVYTIFSWFCTFQCCRFWSSTVPNDFDLELV